MRNLLRVLWTRPWPSKAARQAAIDAAREKLEEARERRVAAEEVASWHRQIRERNHFRAAFEESMRRG